MQPSLRFVLMLTAGGLITAAVSLFFVNRQRDERLRTIAEEVTGGHADAANGAMLRYGCGACHEVPGLQGSNGKVGPSLDGFAARAEIAGLLVNEPESLVRWIREPQRISPGNGMPNLGVTEPEARDIAAYLYTLQ